MSKRKRILCVVLMMWMYLSFAAAMEHSRVIGGSALQDLSKHYSVVSHGIVSAVTPAQRDTNLYLWIIALLSLPFGVTAQVAYILKVIFPDFGYKPPA